jgi:hypothetical protein
LVINGGHFGSYPDSVAARRAIEREVETSIDKLNTDWQRFLNARAARKGAAPSAKPQSDAAADLEASVEEAIVIADGDPRAAVKALLVANAYLESEVERMRETLLSRVFALGEVAGRKGSGAGGPSPHAKMDEKPTSA